MSVPAVAVPGPLLVIARSASRWTVVVALAVLFVALASSPGLVVATVAGSVSTVPFAVVGGTWAPMLKVTLAPDASAPNVHVTVFGAVWLQPDDAPANVVPAGSVSVTVPPLEVEGPLFVTVTVYVMSVPAVEIGRAACRVGMSATRVTVAFAVAVLWAGLSSSG